MNCLRVFVAAALATMVSWVAAAPAGAQLADYGWWLAGSGSGQVLVDRNHLYVSKYSDGTRGRLVTLTPGIVDAWLPVQCALHSVVPGDNAGTPLRLLFANPDPASDHGCAAVSDGAHTQANRFNGWARLWCGGPCATGPQAALWPEGQLWFHPGYVSVELVLVPGRDPASSAAWGTLLAIR